MRGALLGLLALTILIWALMKFGPGFSSEPAHPDYGRDNSTLNGRGLAAGTGNAGVSGEIDEEAQLTRASIDKIEIQLIGDSGSPIDGEVRIIQMTPSLLERIRTGQLRGAWLWEDCLVASEGTVGGRLQLPRELLESRESYCILAFSPGYSPKAIPLPQGEERVTVGLESVRPVSILVQTQSGMPIQGALCTIRHGSRLDSSLLQDWVLGVQMLGFGMTVSTQSNGTATIPIVFPGEFNAIEVLPPEGFAATSLQGVKPNDELIVSCIDAFSLEGVVLDAGTRAPIAEAEILFSINRRGAMQAIGSIKVGQDGSFGHDRLPAGPLLSINVEAPGYSSRTVSSFANEGGVARRMDLLLEPSAAIETRLISSWGEPLGGMPVEVWERRFGWDSILSTTDSQGRLHIEEVGMSASYGLTLHLSPDLWFNAGSPVSVTVQQLEIPGLARIESVSLPPNITAEGGELSWSPLSPDHRGVATWPVGEPSPLLPAGSGMIGWAGPAGGTVKQLAILEEKPDNKLHLAEVESSIRFTWAGPETATLTLLDGQGIFVVDALTIAPGEHEIPCWIGRFELILSTDAGQRTLKPIMAPAGGIDLGELSGFDTASVHGVVLGPDRRPLPDVYVDLLAPDGSFAHTAVSMEDGSFHLTGIPAGEFILAATGDSTYGPDLLETRRALFIRPGESLGPFELVLPIGQEGLAGKVLPIPPAKTAAWIIHGDELVKDEVEFDGSFHLLSPPRPTTVGISRLRTGQILVASTEVPAGARQVALTYPTGEHRLHLLQPSGEPLIDVNIQAFLRGHVLPYQAMPDGEGGLRIQVDADRDVVLQFLLPDGRVEILPIADVLGRSTLTLPSSEAKHRLQVLDEDGEPLPLAVAMRYGIGDRFQADHDGFLLVGDTDDAHPYAIEAPGYLGQWWWPGDAEEVKLEALVERATIEVPGRVEERTVATLLVTPLGLGERSTYPEARMLRVPVEGGTLPLPRLPVGTHRFELLDAEGAVIQAMELPVAHGQALAWPMED
jgi:hypothetical protein